MRFPPPALASILLLGGLSACAPADDVESEAGTPGAAAVTLDADDIARHTRTLSADSFGGRAPGTPGGEMAVAYLTEAFQAAGLEPVDGSWTQPVPMVGSTPRPDGTTLSFTAGGGEVMGEYLTDFVAWSGDAEAPEVEVAGELVFVGYGIEAPEADWSDFEGMDMEGKILLVLVNDPPAPEAEPDLFDGPAMTYYGRWTYKFEEAARQGAAGALMVHVTDMAGYGWNVVASSWSGEQFSLPADPSGPAPTPFQGWITREMAETILGAAGHDLASLMDAAASRDFTPVETGISVDGRVTSSVRTVETQNVVGVLRGAERPDEVITVTSHYDHLGIGQPVDGDSIYNGAYDNASGTGLLIEMAETFAELDPAPARSILFIAAAAEEQGLLGATWYVQSPLFPLERTVAEVNVDGANLWGETDDMTAMGQHRNGLGAVVERHAAEMGITLVPDAEPEKGFFFRSDHFPFAKAGIPALYIEHGRDYRGRPEGWGDSIQADYTANAYHAPADEWSDAFTFEGAVQQGTLAFRTILELANSTDWPNWNEGSEFRAARDAMMGGGM